tara:strand:+ start:120 stop:383 length:264 start_codon:yes stop_codon:yes gene_type:complete
MARKKKNFLKELVSDGSKVSSKRLITLLSFLLIIVGFISNLFFDFTVEEFIFSSVMYIVIAGLGIVGSEKWAPSKNKPSNSIEEEEE